MRPQFHTHELREEYAGTNLTGKIEPGLKALTGITNGKSPGMSIAETTRKPKSVNRKPITDNGLRVTDNEKE